MTRRLPKRVLMTADCVGGVWTYAMELAAGLVERDVSVVLFVSGDALPPHKMLEAGRLDNLTLVRSELKLEWMEGCEGDIAETDAILRDLEAEVRPDIVHVNGYSNAAAGFSAPVVAVAHSCVETWWRACRGEPAPADWDGYRARVARGLAAASAVVAPTHAHADALRQAYGTRSDVHVIHNGRDPAGFAPAAKAPRVLAAGRLWDEAKNMRVLADVARAGVPIALAGDARDRPAEAEGLSWLGALEPADLERHMAQSAVFVAPALYEPFGLAVLEAALCECALVVGDIPTMRELWDGAATFVDPRDPNAIAAALRRHLDDPDHARAAGRAARQRALRYSRRAMAERYRDLYAGLMAAAGPLRVAAE